MTRAFVTKTPIGYFAFDADGNMLFYELFPKDPEKASERIREPISDEFKSHMSDYEITEGERAEKFMRKNMRDFATSLGFADSDAELNSFLTEFARIVSRKKMKESIGRDKFIAQAVHALEDAKKDLNTKIERLNEWFSLYYPEHGLSSRDLPEHIDEYGKRKNFPGFSESAGADMSEEDLAAVHSYASSIMKDSNAVSEMERYVESAMKEITPNMSGIMDTSLASRMLAHAGSLERIARMPASAIQLMGAEKALFRHLKGKGKSPKYGIIFTDTRVQNAPEDKQGKVARVISAKIMQAVRIDFYSARDESERLARELKEELEKI